MTPPSPRVADATFVAVAVAASVGVGASLGKSIWTDEAASLYSAHLSWGQLWQQSHFVDRVYLPYYALLHVWLLVNASVEWARVLSLLAYAVTAILVGRLGYRLRGFWCGVLALVLCASNPIMVEEALSIRPYALTALTATMSVTFLLGWAKNEKNRQLWWWVIGTVTTVALQLFAVLAPLGALAALLALRSKAVKDRWRSVVAPVGVVVVVSVALVLYTLGQRSQINWIRPFTLSSFFVAFYGPAGGSSHVGRLAYTFVVACLLIGGLIVAFRSQGGRKDALVRRDLDPLVVAAAWAIGPAAVLIVASFFSPMYVNRYLTASAPGLALMVALVVAESSRPRGDGSLRVPVWRFAMLAGAAAVLLIARISYSSRYLAENVKGASGHLALDVGSSGVAAFPNRIVEEEFETYLVGKYVALWPLLTHPQSFNEMDLRSLPPSRAPRNVWLATDSSSALAAKFVKELKTEGYAWVAVQAYPGYVGLYLNHYRR